MKHLAKRIFKALKDDLGEIPSQLDTDIPDWTKFENHESAKQVMKKYLEQVTEYLPH